MKTEGEGLNRRNFLRNAGAASVVSALGAGKVLADEHKKEAKTEQAAEKEQAKEKEDKHPKVPKRKFSKKIKEEVPILSMGGMFPIPDNQIVLHTAYKWGVTYWDTANSYEGGNSELGIGKWLKRFPDRRKNLFIVTKASGARNNEQRDKKLQLSLDRMNTKYVDLYYGVHGLRNPETQLTDELKTWAEKAKKAKLIRYFGFSTHSNVTECLEAASKVDWVDAIMLKYNFKMMDDERTQKAIQACYDKGIALIAMKTQAKGMGNEDEKKLIDYFIERGFTSHQAKLKAIWKDKRFCNICSQMPNVKILTENIASAFDKTELKDVDMAVLSDHAKECGGFCAGCANICENAVAGSPDISDTMRYLMYYNSYGEPERAKAEFAAMPADRKRILANADFTEAERKCPQNLPIASLVKEAFEKLA
ncbi:2,5-diketo-D-gluconate reductase A [Anaerohalosphaera lusitana]|uniref:2,5-diketo-D-gluconate reductase A n=1 Tax=Anaerohalosphaera lusitana TaxID=1936003 RepID=A0A1U9NHD5_9BACT|nr:aldo/keto reductase [Anaerohalosphaera lusitana]AQT67020.1 2,5-diketo-D-gluconate reductase A [Anaerohalosphaera lusitana]